MPLPPSAPPSLNATVERVIVTVLFALPVDSIPTLLVVVFLATV